MNTAAQRWAVLGLFAIACFGVAGLGAMATAASLGDGYDGLRKPSWRLPSWLFGPVWTALYAARAVAAWLVWLRVGLPAATGALAWLAAQLILNAGWSWRFFGLRNPGVAAIETLLLWVSILITVLALWRTAPPAGWLMAPYLGWVTFASALNITIWRLNV